MHSYFIYLLYYIYPCVCVYVCACACRRASICPSWMDKREFVGDSSQALSNGLEHDLDVSTITEGQKKGVGQNVERCHHLCGTDSKAPDCAGAAT